jgi:hypothetical protein
MNRIQVFPLLGYDAIQTMFREADITAGLPDLQQAIRTPRRSGSSPSRASPHPEQCRLEIAHVSRGVEHGCALDVSQSFAQLAQRRR